MQKQAPGNGPDEDGIRLLKTKGLRFHNAHLKSKRRRHPRCGFCDKGVGSIIETIKVEEPEPELDADNRTDEERDAASASSRWWAGEEDS